MPNVPELFQEKMKVDKTIDALVRVASQGKIPDQMAWRGLGHIWKREKDRQAELRKACEEYCFGNPKGKKGIS